MLRVRWLGRVAYDEAHVLQRALHSHSEDYLLLLEHPHVFTLGARGRLSNVLVDPELVGASVVRTDRGGDVTYHGPGQLVAYPIVEVPMGHEAIPSHVRRVEQLAIDSLADFGVCAGRLDGFPGVWVEPEGPNPRKICAVGVRVSRGRSMHGLALNVDPDMAWFDRIVPCGISDKPVTSMAAEGVRAALADVVDVVARHAGEIWAEGRLERQGVVSARVGGTVAPGTAGFGPPATRLKGEQLRVRLRRAGVDPDEGLALSSRKPPWLRVRARMGEEFVALKRTVRGLGLVTVCEEAGCPNIFECWGQGTATFMINGERCTRACGFCLVDTSHPLPPDPGEPERVAEAVRSLCLAHAVVTAVARDDLLDGGAGGFAATIEAIRRASPTTAVEVLVPDCKGDLGSLRAIFDARPDVFNHNVETVARLQRAVRPSAGYARSLAVLARANEAGLVTKSGLILGMGETIREVQGTLHDLRSVGVDIVTMGQYIRPCASHLPVARWLSPEEFDRLRDFGLSLGFDHVQSSPLTRSSYHAQDAAVAASSRARASRSQATTASA